MGTHWKSSKNLMGTHWKPSKNLMGTHWKPSKNLMGTLWESSPSPPSQKKNKNWAIEYMLAHLLATQNFYAYLLCSLPFLA
jgi:hypothetical protein